MVRAHYFGAYLPSSWSFVFNLSGHGADFANAGTNKIIVATGSCAQLWSIHHRNDVDKYPDLRYIIVVGGDGDQASTASSVYALPLTVYPTVHDNDGCLANKTNHKLPALTSDDLVTNSDKESGRGRRSPHWSYCCNVCT